MFLGVEAWGSQVRGEEGLGVYCMRLHVTGNRKGVVSSTLSNYGPFQCTPHELALAAWWNGHTGGACADAE